MKINPKKLKDFAIIVGTAIGYLTITIGVLMTILILRTIFSGDPI